MTKCHNEITSGLKAGRMTISWRACLASSCPAMSSNDTDAPLQCVVHRSFINSSIAAFHFTANTAVFKMHRCQPGIFLFKYLSTISFRIKLASLLSTFLKFFISLLGGLTAEVFPFWSFPACGDTWVRNNPEDANFIQTWNYVIPREREKCYLSLPWNQWI